MFDPIKGNKRGFESHTHGAASIEPLHHHRERAVSVELLWTCARFLGVARGSRAGGLYMYQDLRDVW